MPTINEIWAPFLESGQPIPPLEFLQEFLLGMWRTGPSEDDITPEMRERSRDLAATLIRYR